MCNMDPKREDFENGEHVDEEQFLSDDVEEDEEMEGNEHIGQVIDVAFEASCPSDSDFHGIKRLLQQLFVKDLNEELSELSNLIISQGFIGNVLKQDEEEEEDSDEDDSDRDNVFNLNTVINISEHQSPNKSKSDIFKLAKQVWKNPSRNLNNQLFGRKLSSYPVLRKSLSCVEKINEFLMKKCEENFIVEPSRLGNMLRNPLNQLGLLISERFINIPPQVALPSYESLKNDIEKAVRKKKKFDFTHLVLISKTYRAKGEGGAVAGELFYTNPEEQLFSEICEYKYTFSVADQHDSISEGQWDDEGDMESLRTVMVFDASSLGHMINKLRTEIPT